MSHQIRIIDLSRKRHCNFLDVCHMLTIRIVLDKVQRALKWLCVRVCVWQWSSPSVNKALLMDCHGTE